jgi:hypothetical protein
MSKTDNTRPLLIQWGDTTKDGRPQHYHRGEPCDFQPANNVFNYQLKHHLRTQWRNLSEEQPKGCIRMTHIYGGKWYLSGNKKKERQLRRRKYRRREKSALQNVLFGYMEDFDLPGRRYDARTIDWDLT